MFNSFGLLLRRVAMMVEEDAQQQMQNNTYLDELQAEVTSLSPSSHAARLITEGT